MMTPVWSYEEVRVDTVEETKSSFLLTKKGALWKVSEAVDANEITMTFDAPKEKYLDWLLFEHPECVGMNAIASLQANGQNISSQFIGGVNATNQRIRFSHCFSGNYGIRHYIQLINGRIYVADQEIAARFLNSNQIMQVFTSKGHALLCFDSGEIIDLTCLGSAILTPYIDKIMEIDEENHTLTMEHSGVYEIRPADHFVLRQWQRGEELLVMVSHLPTPLKKGRYSWRKMIYQTIFFSPDPEKPLALTTWRNPS